MKAKRKVSEMLDPRAPFLRQARIIHLGEKRGLICDGDLWIAVTDKVLALLERKRKPQ